jgi:hypothetical protein
LLLFLSILPDIRLMQQRWSFFSDT